MENEKINQFLGTALPGHSVTSNQRTLKCKECEQEFHAVVRIIDGHELAPPTRCPRCLAIAAEQENKVRQSKEFESFQSIARDAWFEECNLLSNSKFANKSFEDFNASLQSVAFARVKFYAESGEWKRDDRAGKSLLLLSPNLYGVGKTHLVAALVNYIIATEDAAYIRHERPVKVKCPCYFISEVAMLARIKASYDRRPEGETEDQVYKRLDSYELLVIDDVGKVRPHDFSFLQGVYFRLLDARYGGEQPVVLTTNLSLTELEQHIGGACADRLREMCGKDGFVKMGGKSYRQQ